MTKDEIRRVIDKENGKNYSLNLDLNGYTFKKNNSFVLFELRYVEDIKICIIKYIHFEKMKDLINILVTCCNFWLGNEVQFLYYQEKERRKNSPIDFLRQLNFKVELVENPSWNYKFECVNCNPNDQCHCRLYKLFK